MCYHKLNGIQIGASPSRGETTLIFTKKKTKKMEKGGFFFRQLPRWWREAASGHRR